MEATASEDIMLRGKSPSTMRLHLLFTSDLPAFHLQSSIAPHTPAQSPKPRHTKQQRDGTTAGQGTEDKGRRAKQSLQKET